MPFISIITPVYNGSKMLKVYLDAIHTSVYKDFELILVDDGSQDDFEKLLDDYPVILKRLDQRKGSYFARNTGARCAQGQILLFLDADISIQPQTLGNIVETFHNHPSIAALIGSYDDNPGAGNIISQFKFLYHHYIHQHGLENVGSFWTGCGAVKTEIFYKLGGFNTEIFHDLNAVNDIDFGYKLKMNGYQVFNAKHIQVKHLKRLTFSEWIKTDIFQRGLPWMKILWEYRDFSPTLNVNFVSLLSVMSVWLIIFLAVIPLGLNRYLFGMEAVLGGVFWVCNYGLLEFFRRKKGVLFVFISIPLLFIYYFNCGLCILSLPFLYKRI